MDDVTETLQELVQRRQRELGLRGQPLSAREVWSRGGGDEVWSYETVRRIVEHGHSNISDRVAEAVAKATDVPLSKIYQAAGIRPPLGRFELPTRADRLGPKERKVVLGVIDAILNAHDENDA